MGIKTGRKAAYLGGVALFALGVGLSPIQAEAAANDEAAKPVPLAAPKPVPAPVPQQSDDEDDDLLEEEDDAVEEIQVTGSRLGRSEFAGASPLQIISASRSRELGLFNPTEILQNTSQAAGLQINSQFLGFVLDNGTGAGSISFRGLGAARTLILVNGKRLVSAGVGGAPGSPDTNLLPSIAIDRFENLFDGASAIYGSDAVAGVANVILRDDVDGFEVDVSGSLPEAGGAEQFNVGVLWGHTADNWNILTAFEYQLQENQSFRQNPFTGDCEEYRYETPSGELLTQNRSSSFQAGATPTTCRISATNRIIEGTGVFGSIYRTPGSTNINIPGYSDTTFGNNAIFLGSDINTFAFDSNRDGVVQDPRDPANAFLPTNDLVAFDANGDGIIDVDFGDPRFNFNLTDAAANNDFIPKQQNYNAYAAGAYNFGDDGNTEVYFEAHFNRRETSVREAPPQFFITVPETNPFNPFNPDGVNFAADVFSAFPAFANGPTTALPVLQIRGDRDRSDVSLDQYRGFVGIRGDIGFLEDFVGEDWRYDAYFGYQRSEGFESQPGIDSVALNTSLDNSVVNPDGTVSCTAPDGSTCVPVNLFADSLYTAGASEFATQAEADFLFIDRDFQTDVEQYNFVAAVSGEAFRLPWNETPVPVSFGFEYREDSINSVGNDAASEGLILNFFSDNGAVGSREIYEYFAETRFTLLNGLPGADVLEIEASGRFTNEEFSDTEFTYSLKGIYRPVDFLTVRGTYGTSFRAPNLRERFLVGTTGFVNVADPCIVPDGARQAIDPANPSGPEAYLPSEDQRLQRVLDSCAANGVDPTSLGLRGSESGFRTSAAQSTEAATVGSANPQAETSTSWTLGLIFEQPFTDAFNLTMSATYFSIEIEGGITEPGTGFVVQQCFNNEQQPNGDSGFCPFIDRDENGFIDLVNRPFINIGSETSKGIDFDVAFDTDFEVAGEELRFSLDLNATYLDEQAFDILGNADDNAGEPATVHWSANGLARLTYQEFGLTWGTRWLDGGRPDNLVEFNTAFAPCADSTTVCRPIQVTTSYDVHSLAFTYTAENFTVSVGVENIFDTPPPLVDTADGVFGRNNFPIGLPYEAFGRAFNAGIRYRF